MIKSTELRIGNKIQVFTDIVTVIGIDDDGIIDTTAYFDGHKGCCGCTGDMATGILLMPDILRKCGAQPDNSGWRIKISEHAFLWRGDYERTIRFCSTEMDYSYPIYLKAPIYHFQHLHQLQNLYFSLVGEELTITI